MESEVERCFVIARTEEEMAREEVCWCWKQLFDRFRGSMLFWNAVAVGATFRADRRDRMTRGVSGSRGGDIERVEGGAASVERVEEREGRLRETNRCSQSCIVRKLMM